MDKLMYLFDFEFKRNKEAYFNIITISCTIFLFEMISNLYKYNKVMSKVIIGANSTTLTNRIGSTSFENLLDKAFMSIFVYGLLVCILYSIVIWKKDFSSSNKSIYTLATIPLGRGYIYMSKFFNILCLVYMYITGFMILTLLAYNVLPRFMEGDVVSLGFAKDTIYILGKYIPYNIEQFVLVYVFFMSSAISLIFTLVLIKHLLKSNVKFIGILIIGFIGILIIGFIGFSMLNNLILNKITVISLNTMIVCLSIFIISICTLINRKILNIIDF